MPFSAADYDVRWRVVNTDQEAAQARGLRGGFYKSDAPGARWESTAYHGAHWVEAFVIRKRDDILYRPERPVLRRHRLNDAGSVETDQ